jgi:hypothetical protein
MFFHGHVLIKYECKLAYRYIAKLAAKTPFDKYINLIYNLAAHEGEVGISSFRGRYG